MTYTFMVAPMSRRRAFPIDMLRYDGVIPATEADANRIAASLRSDDDSQEVVLRVPQDKRGRTWKPTAQRWESFGWKCLPVLGS